MDRAGITLASMACLMCHHELQPAYRFCPNCGAAVWQQGAAAGPVENDLQEIITGHLISGFVAKTTKNIQFACYLWKVHSDESFRLLSRLCHLPTNNIVLQPLFHSQILDLISLTGDICQSPLWTQKLLPNDKWVVV